MIVEGGDPRRCPFVRAVLTNDETAIVRLNEADGDPASDQALDVLKGWAAAAAVVRWLLDTFGHVTEQAESLL